MENNNAVAIGFQALRSKDFGAARQSFETVLSTGQETTEVWLGLAAAYDGLNDRSAQKSAIERALALDPRNMRALIAQGDWHDREGDIKTAGGFYGSALSVAAQSAQTPPELADGLQRAQAKCQHYATVYENYLRKSLDPIADEIAANTNGAFNRSLDIMFGKRQIFLQQPQKYYFPELPSIQFYDRKHFDWLAAIESQTPKIRAELDALIAGAGEFTPYVQQKSDTPRTDHLEMFDNPDWSAFFLWKDGAVIPENAARCPATMAAIEKAPLARIPGHSPSILFSLLRPGSKIPPHTGLINTRLIGHLPLVVPNDCGFRVGNETRSWKEGEVFVFDDTIQHEAWNNSTQNRYVLIFDVETPFMSAAEHNAVRNLFAAINDYA